MTEDEARNEGRREGRETVLPKGWVPVERGDRVLCMPLAQTHPWKYWTGTVVAREGIAVWVRTDADRVLRMCLAGAVLRLPLDLGSA